MTRSYQTDDMSESLVDFLLSLPSDLNVRLIGSVGAIVQEVGLDDQAMLVMVTPSAEADAYSPLCDGDTFEVIAASLGAQQGEALRNAGMSDWTADIDDDSELAREWPALEFTCLAPELATA